MELQDLGNGVFLIQAKAPEPLVWKKDKSKKIIAYGANNDYPQDLIEAIGKSSYGAACQKTFAQYLFGRGLEVEGTGMFAQMVKDKIFPPDKVQKICYDYSMFGGFSLQAKYNINAKVQNYNHVDLSTVRLGLYNEANFEVTDAYVSQDWTQWKTKEFKPVLIELFDTIRAQGTIEKFKQDGGANEWNGQLYYAKQYKAGEPFYPSPVWASAINWIYVDGQIALFQANNIDNGFFPSTIIFHPGELDGKTSDGRLKKDAIKDDLKNWQGADNAGKIFNLFGKDANSAPQIIQFTANSNADLFRNLQDITDKKVVSAFQMPKILAGIETPGSLGSTNEIDNAMKFYYSVIKPDVMWIENELNKLLTYCEGYDRTTKVKFLEPLPITPITAIQP